MNKNLLKIIGWFLVVSWSIFYQLLYAEPSDFIIFRRVRIPPGRDIIIVHHPDGRVTEHKRLTSQEFDLLEEGTIIEKRLNNDGQFSVGGRKYPDGNRRPWFIRSQYPYYKARGYVITGVSEEGTKKNFIGKGEILDEQGNVLETVHLSRIYKKIGEEYKVKEVYELILYRRNFDALNENDRIQSWFDEEGFIKMGGRVWIHLGAEYYKRKYYAYITKGKDGVSLIKNLDIFNREGTNIEREIPFALEFNKDGELLNSWYKISPRRFSQLDYRIIKNIFLDEHGFLPFLQGHHRGWTISSNPQHANKPVEIEVIEGKITRAWIEGEEIIFDPPLSL